MPADGHRSALADVVREGTTVAHTAGAQENLPERDLFLDLDAEVDAFADATIAPPARRAGRPPGSPNRTTLQLQKYLRGRGYRDPAEMLAALETADTRALAAALAGVDVKLVTFDQAMEVAKLQAKAAGELMPYFHQKMPVQIEARGDGARPLIMVFEGTPQAGGAGGAAGAMSIHDPVEDQRLIEGVAVRSHGDGSHDEAQAADDST